MYVGANHMLYIAVMQDILQLRCFVLFMCTLFGLTAVTCATLVEGKSQLLEKAFSVVLWAVTRT